jgi:hypothetical protein
MREKSPRHRNPLRQLLLIAFLVATLSAGASPAIAGGGLEVLQAGWDGTMTPNSWNPVRVRVTGGSVDTVGRVEVVLKVRYQPGPQAAATDVPVAAYGQEVTLPAGVSKEVTVWVPPSGEMNLIGDVRLVAGGQVLAEEQVSFRLGANPYLPLVGVLAESPGVARGLGQIELFTQGLPMSLTLARLSAADIPSTAERLGAFGILVAQGNAPSTLTAEQRRAVQEWVAGGGSLLILGGPDAARAAAVLPAGALPISFGELQSAAELSALAGWAGVGERGLAAGPAARIEAREGSLLAGTRERPLAWRLGLGQGTVTLLAVDPSLEPLSSWSGSAAVLKKAVEPALPMSGEHEKMYYIRSMERDSAMQLQDAANALPREAYPDWRWVALLLGGFALAAGPALHLLLRRVDRRGWVWVGVPALALLLSGALYYGGVGRDGRDVLLHVVSHIRLDPTAGQARQLLFAGFFAPTHERLDVTVPGEAPVRVGSSYGNPYGGWISQPGTAEPPFLVTSGRDTKIQFASGQWGMRYVSMSRALGREIGGITASLGVEDGLIKGTVRNDTPYYLEDAAVLVGQSLVKLGSLAPGQTAQVVLDPGPPANPFEGRQNIQALLFGRPPQGSEGASTVGYGYGPTRVSAVAVPAIAPPPMGLPPADAPTPTPAVGAADGESTPIATEDPDSEGPEVPGTRPRSAGQAPDGKPTAEPDPTPDGNATPTPVPAPAAPVQPGQPPYPYGYGKGPGWMEPLIIPNDPEIQRRVRLLNPIVNTPMWGYGGSPSMPLSFIAFTRDAIGEDLPSARNHPTYHLSLLQQALQLDFQAGPFTVPPGLSPAEVIDQSSMGMGGGSNGTHFWMELHGGSVTYGFRPPIPAKAQVDALWITTQQMGAPVSLSSGGRGYGYAPGPDVMPRAADAGVYSLYNWATASWDPLPGGSERTRVSPASSYVGADGQVKLRVAAPADMVLRFVQPDMAVEGRIVE